MEIWRSLKVHSSKLTQPYKRSRIQRYLFPLILICFIFIAKSTLYNLLGEETPFLLFTFAVILTAWFGGLGPGIVFTISAAFIINLFFLSTQDHYFKTDNIIRTIIFVIEGILISMIAEAKSQADLQKDEFIAFAAHEIKNPLAAVKSFAQLLVMRGKQTKDKQVTLYSNKINSSANVITHLINDLMDVSKIESGKFTYEDSYFKFDTFVRDIVDDQRVIHKNLDLTLKGKSHAYILGDSYRLRQVISNLITNAVKYSSSDAQVIVTLKDISKGVKLSVKDSGIGIPRHQLKRVFEKFFRAGNIGVKASGLGLGLYISQEIIKRHKGKMWVESEEGNGSTFFIWLPESSIKTKR
jgi:signal transduction histidine kinase